MTSSLLIDWSAGEAEMTSSRSIDWSVGGGGST